MRVFDFDKTIYNGVSYIDFIIKIGLKDPTLILHLYKDLAISSSTDDQKVLSAFKVIAKVPNLMDEVNDFWKNNSKKIKTWYLEKKDKDDLIITASPDFLIKPCCEQLGIRNPIATKIDINTGEAITPRCYNMEKWNRYKKEYPNIPIEEFYTDSIKEDGPLILVSEKSFLVKRNKVKVLK